MARKPNKGKALMKQQLAAEAAPTTGGVKKPRHRSKGSGTVGPRMWKNTQPDAKIHTHSHIAFIKNMVSQLKGSTYLEVFKKSCFGHLIHLSEINMFSNVIYNVLLKRKYHSKKCTEAEKDVMSFYIGNQEIYFGEREFAMMSGLNFQGSVNIDHIPEQIRLMEAHFPGQYSVKLEDLINKFNQLPKDNEDKLKLGLLYIAEAVIMGQASHWVVDKSRFFLVDKLEDFNRYPWGKLSYKKTIESLICLSEKKNVCNSKHKLGKVHHHQHGFPHVFQAWIFYSIPVLQQAFTEKNEDCPDALNPRILHLKRACKVPSRSRLELSNVKVLSPLLPTLNELKEGYMAGFVSHEEVARAKRPQSDPGIRELNGEDDASAQLVENYSSPTNSLEVGKQNVSGAKEVMTLSGDEDQDADSLENMKLNLRSEIQKLKNEKEELRSDNNNLMEGKALLESEIDSLRNEKSNLGIEIELLHNGKTTLQSDVEFLNKEKSTVQGDICALNERKTDLENETELLNTKLRSEAEFLHKEKSTVQGDIRSLNETKSFLESETESLSNVKTNLENETELLNQEKTKLGMDVVLLNKGKCDGETDLKILQDEKNKLHSDIDSLNKERAKLETDIELTSKEKDKLRSDVEVVNEEKDKLQSDVEFLAEEKAKLEAHTELLSKENTRLQSDFECLNREKSTVQADIGSLNEKKTMLQDNICSLNGKKITVQEDICSLNEKKTTVHGDIRSLNERKTILESEVESLSNEKANLGNETVLLSKEKTKLQGDVCSLNEKEAILESDIQSLNSEKTKLGNETDLLSKEKTELQSDCELLNKEKSTVEGDICNLKDKKTTLENDIRWLNEKKNMVQDDFLSLNGKKTILESEIESVNNVKTNLGNETDLLNKEKTKLLSEFEFLKQEKTKFATDVGLLKERKSELETEIEVSQDEKNELDNDIKLLTQEKDKLQEFLIEPEAEFIHSETSDVNDIGLTLKTSQRGRLLLPALNWWENQQAVYNQDREIIGIQKGSSTAEHPRGMNVLVKKGKRVLDSNFDNHDIGSSSKEKVNQLGAKEFIADLEKQLDNERRKCKLNDQLLKEMTTRMEEQKQELSALVSHLAAKGLRSSKIPRPSRTSNQLTSSGQESSQQSKHESQTSKPILIECRLANVDRSNVSALGTIFYSWTKNQTLDGAELENDCYKVSIDVAIKENAVLPFPDDDGKHRTVEKALGRFVAWPKDLVIPVSEIPEPTKVHPKEKQKTKKRNKTSSDSDTAQIDEDQ